MSDWSTGPHCGGCGQPIEGCAGVDSDWMHVVTRAEACPAGEVARPETEAEMAGRMKALRYQRSRRAA